MRVPAPLWVEKRRSLDRAWSAFRANPEESAEELRGQLRAIASVARAARRRRLSKRLRRLARVLSPLCAHRAARRLLARARELGILSLDVAAMLEERWDESARDDAVEAVERFGRRELRRLRRSLSRGPREEPGDLLPRLRETLTSLHRRAGRGEPLLDGGLRRRGRKAARTSGILDCLRDLGDLSALPELERERQVAEAIARWAARRRLCRWLRAERRDAGRRGAIALASELDRLLALVERSVTASRGEAERRVAEADENVVAFSRGAPSPRGLRRVPREARA